MRSLMKHDITPVAVFDGDALPAKVRFDTTYKTHIFNVFYAFLCVKQICRKERMSRVGRVVTARERRPSTQKLQVISISPASTGSLLLVFLLRWSRTRSHV